MAGAVDRAVEALNARMKGGGFDGSALFVLTGEGGVVVDSDGARAGDGPADVTLTATPEVFEQILQGDLDATSAFMTGRLQVDGDMGQAMRLASLLG